MKLRDARSMKNKCVVDYRPSALELDWFPPDGVENRVCQIAAAQALLHDKGVMAWLNYSVHSQEPSTKRAKHARLQQAVPPSLSTLSLCDAPGCVEYLEPLTGIARHPRASVGCAPAHVFSASPMDINYLVLYNKCPGRRTCTASGGSTLRSAAKGRNLFYDLGAGWYSGQVSVDRGDGMGPSVPLFTELYERHCIEFDRIWAWESAKLKPAMYWAAVPAHVRAKLHFMNTGVEREPHANGALQLLNLTAKREDFVVFKLDVDDGPIEESIVETILADPRLIELIDEFFFEYHFAEPGVLETEWNMTLDVPRHVPLSEAKPTADQALSAMRRLRAQGVRAHFWI